MSKAKRPIHPDPSSIKYSPPWFVDQIIPVGYLTNEAPCMAAWYYYMCCDKMMKTVGKGPEDQRLEYNIHASFNEMPLWMDNRFAGVAKGIAKAYGLKDPDEMKPYLVNVRLEARRLGMPEPEDAYMKMPTFDRIS